MFRTNTCGELRISDAGKKVTLAGWVQRSRKMGGMTFIDVRDRYGITQVVFNIEHDAEPSRSRVCNPDYRYRGRAYSQELQYAHR